MKVRNLVPALMIAALAACDDSPTSSSRLVLEPNFQTGTADGWVVGFMMARPTACLAVFERCT